MENLATDRGLAFEMDADETQLDPGFGDGGAVGEGAETEGPKSWVVAAAPDPSRGSGPESLEDVVSSVDNGLFSPASDSEPTEGKEAQGDSEFLYAGVHEEDRAWRLQPRSHSHFELVVVKSGALHAKIQGRVTIARSGEVFLFPPMVAHEEWAEEGPSRTVSIGFRWEGYRPGMPTELVDQKGRLGELLEWIHAERHARFQDAAKFREQLLRATLCEYLRLSEESGWEPLKLDPENPIVHAVRSFIREHLADHFTLDDLAAQVKMSKFYFARAYRSLTGLSPMDHARLIRLEAARELLLTTNLPLKAIAPRVGFASEFHLSRLLRTRLGVGARQIRARQSAMS